MQQREVFISGSMSVLGQRPKAQEKSCQHTHLSGVGAPGESRLTHPWAAYTMSSSVLEREAGVPTVRLAGLLLIGVKKRRSSPHCLPSFLGEGRLHLETVSLPLPTLPAAT